MTRRGLLATLGAFLAAPFVAKAKPLENRRTLHIFYDSKDWIRVEPIARDGSATVHVAPELRRLLLQLEPVAATCGAFAIHGLTPLHKITGERFAAHVTEEPSGRIEVTIISEPSFETRRSLAQWVRKFPEEPG